MADTSSATRRLLARCVIAGMLAVLAAACTTPPDPLPRLDVPAHRPADPVRPCVRDNTPPPDPAPEPGDAEVRFDRASNTITVARGEDVTIPTLGDEVPASALRDLGNGEWLLEANITVLTDASLRISAPDVRWLKMASGDGAFVAITALGGGITVEGVCITSWDEANGRVDENHTDRRSYVLARDGATMTIRDSEIRYLGSGDVEAYGLAWRTEGTTGSITDSVVSNLYFGLYSHEVDGLQVIDNEFHDNVLYGVDPHTGSRNMTIEGNRVHHNGKHGIILAEDCVDSVVRDNVVYANEHHGIVMYLRSDNNVIEGNETFDNAAQGININESNGNTIRGNKVYDNAESGITITQTGRDNVVADNEVRGNGKDGVRLVSESVGTAVRGNTIGRNERYGIYIDTEGAFDISKNTIFGNRIGITARGHELEEGDNEVFDNGQGAVLTR
ncbi:MAG TPA: right-handed parallel beta-helix repeat-containing protein [Pseudonocardia sp.]|uniref:right-handed parallel beta-helix repeat-containing protein n=1 Tax=Pseudonocardia sp. TaxID=60912 RepID=UPI002B4B39D6|nr:right-handed parallel beta-helix repeat-containing protein [Pseudonocardia sp.]HLU60321.1 right-handed parallel beta-helix repeat-containing protein [Pseudonocardia sp.]